MGVATNQVLKLGQDILKKGGIKSHLLEASMLLEHCSDMPLERMVAHPEYHVSKNIKDKFLLLVQRRLNGEPMSYVRQTSYFYSKSYFITRGVFIPRPDTELLVEIAVAEIKKNLSAGVVCLDMCTGGGCVGLTIVGEAPNIKRIFLVDNSKKALDCCRKNQKNMGLKTKTKIISSNLFQNVPKIEFDYIVSNPPYVTEEEYRKLDLSIKKFEPKGALFSKSNGLTHIRKIALGGAKALKKGGMIFLEVGYRQAGDVKQLLEATGYENIKSYRDLNKIDRVISGTWKN